MSQSKQREQDETVEEITSSPVSYIDTPDNISDQAVTDQPEIEELSINYPEVEPILQARQRSLPRWLLFTVVMLILIGWNFLIEWLGQTWFWSEQLMYWLSLAGTFVTIFLLMFWGMRQLSLAPRSLMLIGLLATFVAAIVLSVMKFINVSVFWTFFNLITQPLNALALCLLAIRLASKLTSRSQSSTLRVSDRNERQM